MNVCPKCGTRFPEPCVCPGCITPTEKRARHETPWDAMTREQQALDALMRERPRPR